VVWVVGLALLADIVPENKIGTQMGFAMMGLSLGLVIGPPVGGGLYSRFGFRAPFIVGEICTVIDLLGRLLIIETKVIDNWNVNPVALPGASDARADLVSYGNNMIDDPTENTPLLRSSRLPPSDIASVGTADHLNGTQPSCDDAADCNKPLSLIAVVIKLARSPRALVGLIITFSYGVTYTSQEPALPVRMQRLYGFDSWEVGLVFLAAVLPTIFSGPFSGWLADRKGTEWISTLCIGFALPWWIVISFRLPVWMFVTAFAIESFFSSGLNSLVSAELAAVARNNEGIGYAHIYGALNIAYGVGSAVGPVLGGQIYDRVEQGWMVLCLLSAGLLTVCFCLSFGFVGTDPLLSRLLRRIRSRKDNAEDTASVGA